MNTAIASLAEPQDTNAAIFSFWKAAYSRYRRPIAEGLGFFVPEFPIPLLSPCFLTGEKTAFLRANPWLSHFNEVLPLGYGQREAAPLGFRLEMQFYLGERRIAANPLNSELAVQIMPLAEALNGEELWCLLGKGFPRDAPFLRTLLPFLTTLDADFRTIFLQERGNTVGVVSIGVAGGVALVLNAVTAPESRGRGVSRMLAQVAEDLAHRLGAERAFYWSELPFLGKHADIVRHYRIYSRS
jgi:GNAT superfamily N-acetyltransferase